MNLLKQSVAVYKYNSSMEKKIAIYSYTVFHKLTALMIALEFNLLTSLLLLSITEWWKVTDEKPPIFVLF